MKAFLNSRLRQMTNATRVPLAMPQNPSYLLCAILLYDIIYRCPCVTSHLAYLAPARALAVPSNLSKLEACHLACSRARVLATLPKLCSPRRRITVSSKNQNRDPYALGNDGARNLTRIAEFIRQRRRRPSHIGHSIV